MTHTPGPWTIKEIDSDRSRVRISPYEPRSIEITGADHEANARLIAAAPDLLQAAKKLRETLLLVSLNAPGYDWNVDPLSLTLPIGEALEMSRAAIAKATQS